MAGVGEGMRRAGWGIGLGSPSVTARAACSTGRCIFSPPPAQPFSRVGVFNLSTLAQGVTSPGKWCLSELQDLEPDNPSSTPDTV